MIPEAGQTAALSVEFWPDAGCSATWPDDLCVLALATPQTTQRDAARLLVRTALRQILAQKLACPPAEIHLLSIAGQGLRLAGQSNVGISVSHESGLSLIGLHRSGPIGIDLLRLPETPEWQAEIPRLASDYLGPEMSTTLARQPDTVRVRCFAQAWTHLEAGLKCLGCGLEEWTPNRQQALQNCQCRPLSLPAGFVGSVAWPAVQKR